MSASLLVFFVLVILVIGGSLVCLSATKPNHVIISLVVTFLSIAGIYTLLSAGIAAAVQLVIYAGVFSLLTKCITLRINHDDLDKNSGGRSRTYLSVAGALIFFVILFSSLDDLALAGGAPLYGHIAGKVETGFSSYFLSLVLLLVLLFIAFIGSRALLINRHLKEKGLRKDD